ncbi:MAG: hypothetical protein QCI00_03720 [Candidatus Thermoplasmatota archaeon]|nr:hypothetical protein [Candidatus Thermoplasmatota archaeon]
MNEKKNIIDEIYESSNTGLSITAEESINEACTLLQKYANKIVNNADISSNRWILLNLLDVLYRDIFLLQTRDFEDIIKNNPKKKEPGFSRRCYECNKQMTNPVELRKLSEEERIKGLCLNCFIYRVKNGDWWIEYYDRLKNKI